MMDATIGAIHAGGWGGGFPGPWMFFPALFWVALLGLLAWFAARRLSTQRPGSGAAEGILRERFARGEITAEEYQRASEALRRSSSHGSYEDYVREAEERLRAERGKDS